MFKKKFLGFKRNSHSNTSIIYTSTDSTGLTTRTNSTAKTISTAKTPATAATTPLERGRTNEVEPSNLPTQYLGHEYREKVKSEELRHLRELIRRRYALDVQIWEKKDIVYGSRSVVQE